MSDKKGQDNAIVRFFKEVKGELKKVVYPTFKNVRKNTTVVVIVVIIFGLLIAALDAAFTFGRNALIQDDSISQTDIGTIPDGALDETQIPIENGDMEITDPNADPNVDSDAGSNDDTSASPSTTGGE